MRLLPLLKHPYFLTHLATFAAYPFVREAYLNIKELNQEVGFGMTRETMVIFMFAVIIVFKLNSFWTPEHFVTVIAFYMRIMIAILAYFGKSYQVIFLYCVAWFALWATIDLPRYTESSSLIDVTGPEFLSIMSNFEENKAKHPGIADRFVFCVFYSELAPESILVKLLDRADLGGICRKILKRRFFIL